MMQSLNKGLKIHIPFRSCETHMIPIPEKVKKFEWSVKVTGSLQRPLYAIIGMQKARLEDVTKKKTYFDHADLRNVNLRIGGKTYPYFN